MKVLKKIIFVVVGLIALVAISLYLFLKVREAQSQKALVHRDSDIVVKIAVDKVLTGIAWNALMNPSYYLAKDTAAVGSEKKSSLSEIVGDVPANIYLFTVNDQPGVWYSLLEVSNAQKLQSFICKHMDRDTSQIERQKDNWWLSSGRVSFYGDAKKVLISINAGKADIKESVIELWNSTANDFVQISTLADFKLDNSGQDVQWQHRASGAKGGVAFSAGEISSSWTLSNNLLKLSREVEARELPTSNAVNLYCSADLRPLLQRYTDKLNEFNVPVDTLMTYYGGYLDFQWREQDVLQSDSVITYEYDDNFNPIAKKELREEYVPNLLFTFNASPHLSSYLPEKLFYKFFKTMDGNKIGLSTDGKALNSFPVSQQDHAFALTYKRSEAVLRHLAWLPNIDRISSLFLKGSGGEVVNNFNATMNLTQDNIHALYQLLK